MKPQSPLHPSKAGVGTGPEERECLARCRAGDAQAYRALVERYQDRACAMAFRIVRSRPDAEEVAQDAFVRAWRAIGEFRGDASFMTWLYRILVRLALDRAELLRSRRSRETAIDDPDAGALAVRVGPGADLDRGRGAARILGRLLEDLPLAQRAAVTLFYYEDHPVAEIARILDMPENTVKTHLSRARAALRQGYERERRAGGVREL
jgi:RNA polymerase sigma-70 factor, ECF subfamily